MTATPSIIIIGAGISGLTLAHGLQKAGIPYQIFERDASLSARSAGWGLTIHWALSAFHDLIPDELRARLPETYVNREAVEKGENGTFTFFDLSNGEAKWKVPAAKRTRVSRDRLRRLLTTGVEIHWSKRLVLVDHSTGSVTAQFDDGTSCTGTMLVGCDGSLSRVREICYPSTYQTYKLPIRLLGVTVQYTAQEVDEVLQLDPFFFQGSDPRSDSYLWFSFLDAPQTGEHSSGSCTCQIIVSWPYRSGFLHSPTPIDYPASNAERLDFMKQLADPWTEPFKSIVQKIPTAAEVKGIKLEDWVPEGLSQGRGRITMIGDAAHPMTMFRGEGANHAILDASNLLQHLQPLAAKLTRSQPDTPAPGDNDEQFSKSIEGAISAFEEERDIRCRIAVQASRQACLDAHDHARINERSPLIMRRAVVVPTEGGEGLGKGG